MQDVKLFEKWKLQGLLDELGVIELSESPEHGRLLSEVTKKQEELFLALRITPPSVYLVEIQDT